MCIMLKIQEKNRNKNEYVVNKMLAQINDEINYKIHKILRISQKITLYSLTKQCLLFVLR